jgi:hypothetical protein
MHPGKRRNILQHRIAVHRYSHSAGLSKKPRDVGIHGRIEGYMGLSAHEHHRIPLPPGEGKSLPPDSLQTLLVRLMLVCGPSKGPPKRRRRPSKFRLGPPGPVAEPLPSKRGRIEPLVEAADERP